VSSPVVSIVTPSYNQGSFIRDTIESVQRQDYDHIEHIVVDGKSTDDTLDILQSYDHLDWISEPDDGQADAINKGVERASGSLVTWLNTDDIYLHTDTISMIVARFDDQTDVVYGDIAFMSAGTTIEYVFCPPRFDYEKLTKGRISMPPQPATVFDADLFADRPLDETLDYVLDYEFWLRNGADIDATYVDRPIAGFRHHDESKTMSTPEGFEQERRRVDREYGVESPSTPVRLVDITTSGLPRRVRALGKVHRLRRTLAERGTIPDSTVAPVLRASVSTLRQEAR
jgi:glycosyltransferase involved in cell wall biosynthesis